MITEYDINAAIAECQGVKNPNAKTCIMLAAYLTIKRELFDKEERIPEIGSYSFDLAPNTSVETITYNSDTEFSSLINGRKSDEIWAIMDELMSTLKIVNISLYKGVMHEIKEG